MRPPILLGTRASRYAAPGALEVRILDSDHKTITAARVNVMVRKGNRGNVTPS